ncbi:MAG TPA: hypothetical protein DDY54_01865 [Deltaproteobacteria bacterium]|nr:hypothetical protein [Deltaproteobacteria bacterium]
MTFLTGRLNGSLIGILGQQRFESDDKFSSKECFLLGLQSQRIIPLAHTRWLPKGVQPDRIVDL